MGFSLKNAIMKTCKNRYVFAAPPYTNAAPLTHFLSVCKDIEVIFDMPSALVGKLTTAQADAALIPVADYFAEPGLETVPGLGICSDGAVKSVLLKCRLPIERVRTVETDPASRTSNALAEIVLKKRFRLPVKMHPPVPGEPADARVVIGDRALCEPPAPRGDYDLAAQWKEMTGLPFVFAVWAYQNRRSDGIELARIAHAAKDEGMRHLDQLAELHAARLDIPRQRCLDYLTSAVRYDLGPREMEAMRLFKEWIQCL